MVQEARGKAVVVAQKKGRSSRQGKILDQGGAAVLSEREGTVRGRSSTVVRKIPIHPLHPSLARIRPGQRHVKSTPEVNH